MYFYFKGILFTIKIFNNTNSFDPAKKPSAGAFPTVLRNEPTDFTNFALPFLNIAELKSHTVERNV